MNISTGPLSVTGALIKKKYMQLSIAQVGAQDLYETWEEEYLI